MMMLQFLCLGVHQVRTVEFVPTYVAIGNVGNVGNAAYFYRVSALSVTQAQQIQVLGKATSGNVVAIVVAMKDGLWLTVGSDHFDRVVQQNSPALAKQLCPLVLSNQAWRLDEVQAHLEQIVLRSAIVEIGATTTRVPYQEGTLATTMPLLKAVETLAAQQQMAELASGTVLGCGSVAEIGEVRGAKSFVMQMIDPVLNRTIEYRYDIECLPQA
jgi:Protein of unknown function (DUF2848)